MGGQRGQGTIEYLAMVLLVALVLGAAAGVVAATGIGDGVLAAMRRALCVVTGMGCDRPAAPCVRSSERHEEGLAVDAFVVRIADRSAELRERYADGRVALTVLDGAQRGLVARGGIEAHVRWGGSSWAYGQELRFAMLAERSTGRTWIRPDAAQAQALSDQVKLERLSAYPKNTIEGYDSRPPLRPEVHAPPPDITFSERGISAEGSFDLGPSAGVQLHGRRAYGERVDHRSGERTVYVRNEGGGAATLTLEQAGAEGSLTGEERYGVTYDRDGRPVELAVLTALDVEGAVKLPAPLTRIAGRLGIPADGARHIESEQRLALGDPADARLAAAFLSGDGAAARALRERLAVVGDERLRSYRTEGSAREVGAHVGNVGGTVGSSHGSARLDRALVRRAGGTWVADAACAAGAAGAAA